MNEKSQANPVGFDRRNELHINVQRACTHCGAPGVWHNIPGEVNARCYDPLRAGQPIGDICPQCDSPRVANEPHGLVWYQRLFGTMFMETGNNKGETK